VVNVLVISPFAPVPADAGHRMRVRQTLLDLRTFANRIDFLHLCFEEPWRWSIPLQEQRQIQTLVDGYYPVPAPVAAGLPPKANGVHDLDEWWTESLERQLKDFLSLNTYDAVIVHNVWLSKALSFVPPRTCRLIEMHDLFYPRAEFYARMGMTPEFFLPTRDGEIFGLNRADGLISIQPAEADKLRQMLTRQIISIPFWLPEYDGRAAIRTQYQSGNSLTVGFIGSAHPFNVEGINLFLAALEREIYNSMAPVSVVVAGAVCEHVKTALPVRLLGRVETEAELTGQVDFVVAPVFNGSGLKIKVIESLANAIPILAAKHASLGIPVPEDWQAETPEDLARLVAGFSFRRPPMEQLSRTAMEAGLLARKAVTDGVGELRAFVDGWSERLLFVISDDPDLAPLQAAAYLSAARVLKDHMRIGIVAPKGIASLGGQKVASGIQLFTDLASAMAAFAPRIILSSQPVADAGGAMVVCDGRFTGKVFGQAVITNAPHLAAGVPSLYLPVFNGPFYWEPATLAVIAAYKRANRDAHARQEGSVTHIIDERGVFTSSALLAMLGADASLLQRAALTDAQSGVFGDAIATGAITIAQDTPATLAAVPADVWKCRSIADRTIVRGFKSLSKMRADHV